MFLEWAPSSLHVLTCCLTKQSRLESELERRMDRLNRMERALEGGYGSYGYGRGRYGGYGGSRYGSRYGGGYGYDRYDYDRYGTGRQNRWGGALGINSGSYYRNRDRYYGDYY